MVNFAELKAKAEKVKDAGVNKVVNTKDRYSSISSSKANWDPNWKRAPPPSSTQGLPPVRSSNTSGGAVDSDDPPPPSVLRSQFENLRTRTTPPNSTPPTAPRATRPEHPSAPFKLPSPPTRVPSGYPPGNRSSDEGLEGIDWTRISAEDKEEFFRWLDEFFSRYLGVEVGSIKSGVVAPSLPRSGQTPPPVPRSGAPPPVKVATRPRFP